MEDPEDDYSRQEYTSIQQLMNWNESELIFFDKPQQTTQGLRNFFHGLLFINPKQEHPELVLPGERRSIQLCYLRQSVSNASPLTFWKWVFTDSLIANLTSFHDTEQNKQNFHFPNESSIQQTSSRVVHWSSNRLFVLGNITKELSKALIEQHASLEENLKKAQERFAKKGTQTQLWHFSPQLLSYHLLNSLWVWGRSMMLNQTFLNQKLENIFVGDETAHENTGSASFLLWKLHQPHLSRWLQIVATKLVLSKFPLFSRLRSFRVSTSHEISDLPQGKTNQRKEQTKDSKRIFNEQECWGI